ncbi:hypothetical protein PsAD46_04068 [Pseudovibrio sp. Ad46]|nr:hypothetical protein PsAD46_04068 [Pseudovibrio sp. Ad46]
MFKIDGYRVTFAHYAACSRCMTNLEAWGEQRSAFSRLHAEPLIWTHRLIASLYCYKLWSRSIRLHWRSSYFAKLCLHLTIGFVRVPDPLGLTDRKLPRLRYKASRILLATHLALSADHYSCWLFLSKVGQCAQRALLCWRIRQGSLHIFAIPIATRIRRSVDLRNPSGGLLHERR